MKYLNIKQFTLITIIILQVSQIMASPVIIESLLKKINTGDDETSCAITGDQKFFIFARKPKDSSNSDLYFSELKNGKWTDAAALSVINSESDDISPYISSDGKFILFSSNRSGSLKTSGADKPSYDIYYSERKKQEWSKPELLFGTVNTTDDELNPFLAKNGNLLYFTRSESGDSSKKTIIKVNKENDAWENISNAEISKNKEVDVYLYKKSLYRAGAYLTGFKTDDLANRDVFFTDASEKIINSINGTVNTSGDEISITELSKDSIIVSSNSEGINGSYDLFIRNITPETKIEPSKPLSLSLKIESENYTDLSEIEVNVLFFSSLEKNSLPVKTELQSPDSSGMITIAIDPEIKRILILPPDSEMKPFAVEFLTGDKFLITSRTIKIEPAEENGFIVKPVYFRFNSSEIMSKDIPYLHKLINYLRENENTRLLLEGYSDGIGSSKANIEISIRRAERVKKYIIDAGIKKERIEAKGLGYVKENATDTSQYERRVDLSFITE